MELTVSGERVGTVSVWLTVGAKTGPICDRPALVDVAASLYYRNQIASLRIRLEHRFKCGIDYSLVHTVCHISTVADID